MSLSDRVEVRPWRTRVLIAAVYSLWATTWPVGKYALRSWSPLGLIAVRHAVAGALLLLVGGSSRSAGSGRVVVAVGLLQYFAYYFLSYVALARMDSGTVALVSGCYPVFVAFFPGKGRGQARPTAREWLALGVVVAGSVLIAVESSGAGVPSAATAPSSLLFALLAAACFAAATVFSARALPPTASVGELSRFVGAAMLVASGAAGTAAFIGRGSLRSGFIDASAVLAVIYLSVLGSAAVFLVHTALLRREAAWKVAAGYPLVPALALVFGALFLGEVPGWSMLPGMALLFGGLFSLGRASAPSSRRS